MQLRPVGPPSGPRRGRRRRPRPSPWRPGRARGSTPTRWCRPRETVLFDGVADLAALAGVLAGWTPTARRRRRAGRDPGRRTTAPTSAFVAEAWGTDVDGVVARHTEIEYVAAFCGFAPGFSYLAGLPDELAVPRLESPRAAGAGRLGRAGRHLVRRLPDRVAGRLAAARPHRRRAVGPDARPSRRCWRRAPGCGSWPR